MTSQSPEISWKMSDPSATILAMETWNKWDYLCTHCDANIEMTIKSDGQPHNSSCPKCGFKMTLMSVLDATIQPTETKEEKMEENTFNWEEASKSWQTKAENFERMFESYRDKASNLQSQINRIIDNMTEDYWFNPNTDAQVILDDLCEILDYKPKKEISFTAVMHFNGRIDIDLADAQDFDLMEFLSDAYVDVNHGDVVIDDYELTEADEC